MSKSPQSESDDFASQAEGANQSIVREFWDLLRHNKKWWLLPVIVALLVLGAVVILGGTPAGAFIYTLF